MNYIILLTASVILSAIFTNKFLKALGIPALLTFLLLGMLFGSEGIFKIYFSDFSLAKELSSIALGFIIFYGGFCTKWKTAKPVIFQAGILSTLGAVSTACLVCIFCRFILNLDLYESFLIGAVICSTDAASIFSILKAKRLNLKENTGSLIEIESGSNDPMSYVLVILAITLIQGQSAGFVFILFIKQIVIGILIGLVLSHCAIFVFKKTHIITDGNDSLFIIALVLAGYAIPEIFNGNQFLALYILGIILGNIDIDNKVSMMHFFDGLTKLAQIGIFFTLGLLANPSEIPKILWTGSLIFLFLSIIARPLTVWLLLSPFKSSKGQILLTSWAGLRGVASIVFAIIAMDRVTLNYDLFHLVFLISILSVAIQGSFLPYIAQKTNMIDNFYDIKKTFNDYEEECAIKFMRVTVPPNHEWIGKRIRDITFPQNALVLIIKRGNNRLMPKNHTKIKEGDRITLTLPSDLIYNIEHEQIS